MKYSIKDGWVVDEEGRCSLSERQLREAGVEFWAEIERLQSVNAELLAALKEIDLSDTEAVYALGSAAANQIRAAIARAEQHTNPESKT